jgi:predicted nucleic acid-binding protein
MKVLLDTCVLSALRQPANAPVIHKVLQPMDVSDLFISVITLGEITKGITLLPKSKKKTELATWIMTLENHYADRVLNIDRDVSCIWGELTAKAQSRGKVVSMADGLIAATALAHGLHVMTRNVSDFEVTGALIFNPWC